MYAVQAQLWGLLVVASVDPRLGAEERANEGELVDVSARQLGGFEVENAVALGSRWSRRVDGVEKSDSVSRDEWVLRSMGERRTRVESATGGEGDTNAVSEQANCALAKCC